MMLTRWYRGWYYNEPEFTGLTFFSKLQWNCYAKPSDGRYRPNVGYPTILDPAASHVIVFARTHKKAIKQVEKILKKSNKAYR
jgi:hypothetical protein